MIPLIAFILLLAIVKGLLLAATYMLPFWFTVLVCGLTGGLVLFVYGLVRGAMNWVHHKKENPGRTVLDIALKVVFRGLDPMKEAVVAELRAASTAMGLRQAAIGLPLGALFGAGLGWLWPLT